MTSRIGSLVHTHSGSLYMKQFVAADLMMSEYQTYAKAIGCKVEPPDVIMVDTPEQAKLLSEKWTELTSG